MSESSELSVKADAEQQTSRASDVFRLGLYLYLSSFLSPPSAYILAISPPIWRIGIRCQRSPSAPAPITVRTSIQSTIVRPCIGSVVLRPDRKFFDLHGGKCIFGFIQRLGHRPGDFSNNRNARSP